MKISVRTCLLQSHTGLNAEILKVLIFPNDLRSICRSSLLALEHLKVKTYSPLLKKSDLMEAMYWLSPSLKSLSMEQQASRFFY
ncbi:hypothetical protein L484_010963 [Morus notabilis]|uniref:Uncharacterized protein n=1 Tax=Morus notabilis TaxID=981085 RepID=W9RAV3_9ROSA|nr:hypothetical protein L484_010963 [Morus notabilis]